MKWKFWEKETEPAYYSADAIEAQPEIQVQVLVEMHKELKRAEERSGFIREMSHKHLTTRGRR